MCREWPEHSIGDLIVSAIWLERLRRTEYLLLCALALVLPIFETPKNLVLFLLLFVLVAQCVVSRDFAFRRPDIIEISLVLMLVSCLASTLANWPLANWFKGLRHTLAQVLVFWMIYRAAYSERQQLRFVEMAVAGVAIGFLWSIAEYVQGHHEYLVLHSVGNVLESSVYLGIALAIAFSVAWVASDGTSEPRAARHVAPWWTAVAVMLVGLFLTGSRAAILAVIVACVVYALAIGRRSFWLAVMGCVALAVVFTTMLPDWFNHGRWIGKIQEMSVTDQPRLAMSDQIRVDHWRVGIRQIAQGNTVMLGIGPHNSITLDHSKMAFDPPLLPIPAQLLHFHNMFLTKLVEEGVLGLASMLFFFSLVVVRIMHDRRRDEWRRWTWFAAVGALTVAIGASQVGPRWHQEQVLFVMVILGVYLGSRRHRGVPD